jgi:CRISPR-associated protein (TIGR03985 family)
MSEFKHQPSIQVLQALVSASFTELNNLNKAVRLWYTLRELGVEFQPAQFTDRSWREHLYESPDRNRDNKPEQIDGCLCTKTIADILFDRAQDRADLWSNWKLSLRESLIEYYGARDLPEIADRKLADYLIALELEKPFDVTGKTILGDLKTLAQIPKTSANKYLISIGTSEFQLPDEFPPTLVETQHIDRSRLIISAEEPRSLQDPAYLTGDFSSLAYLFAEPTREIQRFHIHADYHTPQDKLLEVNQYLKRLRENWSKDRSTPCQLQYYSSSQIGAERRYTIVVYPVCLYYYQRAFYLCAFGLGFEAKYEWHNYRLDRIERLEDLDWQQNRDIIPQLLFDTCDRVDDLQLLDVVKSELEEAYGFDFYRKSKEMVLRFDREFHDRYIANTFRHQTFQPISKQVLLKADPNLAGTVDRYPDGAFYTMNYRVGDNSVIMRLRAWGQNVEVLSPSELRDRMRDDIRQTWELYNGDADRG